MNERRENAVKLLQYIGNLSSEKPIKRLNINSCPPENFDRQDKISLFEELLDRGLLRSSRKTSTMKQTVYTNVDLSIEGWDWLNQNTEK